MSPALVKDINEEILQQSLYEHLEKNWALNLLALLNQLKLQLQRIMKRNICIFLKKAPVLVMRQWSYSEGEVPLEYVKCIYRGIVISLLRTSHVTNNIFQFVKYSKCQIV